MLISTQEKYSVRFSHVFRFTTLWRDVSIPSSINTAEKFAEWLKNNGCEGRFRCIEIPDNLNGPPKEYTFDVECEPTYKVNWFRKFWKQRGKACEDISD